MTENAGFEHRLTIELMNDQPVELLDFTGSLLGLAEEYRRFTSRMAEFPGGNEAKLYVKEIRTGSIVTDLVSYAPFALPFVEHAKSISDFAEYLKGVFDFFLGKQHAAPLMEKADMENILRFAEPIAKDQASQMNCNVVINGDFKPVFAFDSVQANTVQNGIRRKLESIKEPVAGVKDRVLLYWYQARKDLKSTTGDKAVVESIVNKPVKTIFANDRLKAEMLLNSENPFHMSYIVDVAIETINNKPVLYKILFVHEKLEDQTPFDGGEE